MIVCYLGLGSNLRSPERQLRQAITALRQLPNTYVLRIAQFYKTKAFGRKAQPDYYNTAVALSTRLKPNQLLSFCQKIEREHGRTRKIKWGSRTIDIDILLFGSQKIASPRLTIPHPMLHLRDFVVVPLLEILTQVPTFNGIPLTEWIAQEQTERTIQYF